ncbi:MAG TPA: hypothetical protein VKB46_01690 [Pyrinomonadaceae bacterium]|nr:hypothetical protein [Pyrinomonadaceae bacterium]
MSRVLQILANSLFHNANPTNGSWWMVQILSEDGPRQDDRITKISQTFACRLDMNHPPTSVGGIWSCAKLLGAVALIALTFSAAIAQEKKISRAQLPAAVEKTVAKESEGATIKGFATEVEHGQRFYEASLEINGHAKDILIDKDGNVVEVEEEVALDTLPAAVQDALKKAAGAGTIQVVESLTKNGTLVAYEGHVKRGYKRSEIQVGPNGEKLKRPE